MKIVCPHEDRMNTCDLYQDSCHSPYNHMKSDDFKHTSREKSVVTHYLYGRGV